MNEKYIIKRVIQIKESYSHTRVILTHYININNNSDYLSLLRQIRLIQASNITIFKSRII